MPENPESLTSKIDRLLERRPPLPPTPTSARWNWTRQKLKAVYLDAFANLGTEETAQAVGVKRVAIWSWRRAPDYKRYLATLIAADGLADRAQRVKARKTLAQSLGDAIALKMQSPSALAGEKLSSLLRAQREMLDALQDDAQSLAELGQEQDAAARANGPRPALDFAERLAAIPDQAEREIVRKHLMQMMGDYLETPRILDAETVPNEPGAAEPAGQPRRKDAETAAIDFCTQVSPEAEGRQSLTLGDFAPDLGIPERPK